MRDSSLIPRFSCLMLARVQDREAYDFTILAPNDHIIVRNVAVGGVAWLLEIDVESISLSIIR